MWQSQCSVNGYKSAVLAMAILNAIKKKKTSLTSTLTNYIQPRIYTNMISLSGIKNFRKKPVGIIQTPRLRTLYEEAYPDSTKAPFFWDQYFKDKFPETQFTHEELEPTTGNEAGPKLICITGANPSVFFMWLKTDNGMGPGSMETETLNAIEKAFGSDRPRQALGGDVDKRETFYVFLHYGLRGKFCQIGRKGKLFTRPIRGRIVKGYETSYLGPAERKSSQFDGDVEYIKAAMAQPAITCAKPL